MKTMQSPKQLRNKIMKEALELQSRWEQALARITKGRQYDDLTPDEQEEWKRISVDYNDRIDIKLRELE